MAQTRKRSTSKSGTAKKGGSRTKETKPTSAQRQVAAVLLFVGALLMLCILLVPGGSLWGHLQRFFYGLFGYCAFLVPLLMGYLAVMTAMEKTAGTTGQKLWQSVLLIVMVSAAVHIFAVDQADSWWTAVKAGYTGGGTMNGDSLLGAALGWVLRALFDDIGSKIIILLLIFVYLMLVTGTTILDFFRMLWKPVEKTRDGIENAIEAGAERRSARQTANIDIDMGEGYPAPKRRKEENSETDLAIDRIIKGSAPDGVPPAAETAPAKALKQAARELQEEDGRPAVRLDDIIGRAVNRDKPDKTEEKPEKASAAEIAGETAAIAAEIGSAERPAEVYRKPPLSLLDEPRRADDARAAQELQQNADTLVKTLKDFGVETRVVAIARGPSVTRYELEPSAGVKISRITNLADDLALRLATTGVRIEAPIPNKAAVGIEVPNRTSQTVCLRELLDSDEFRSAKSKLTVALGRDIAGKIVLADLAKMPHLLIAGTTGSGKSVCTNSMIQSVLYNASPAEVRLLLIDPKQVEFGVYNGIPHLLVPVVTDPRKAAGALGWAVTEMLGRYKMFAENNVRDLDSYNDLAARNEKLTVLPRILIVIDELADLMMAAASEVEDAIIRLAQMARAAGMHLVIATQRPSVDVITGLIKANIPSRLALTVASQVDSRTIIDTGGAEKLLGKGDMLFMPVGMAKPMRVQGCFVSNREVESVVEFLKPAVETTYDEAIIQEIDRQAAASGKSAAGADEDLGDGEGDELLPQAIETVVEAGMASTTMVQRRLRVGYARAGRLMDEMEQRGIIGPHEGSKPRQVLITRQQWLERSMTQSEE